MASKLGMLVTYIAGLLTIKSHQVFSGVLAKSHNKLKPLYFHHRSAYGHQTWKDGGSL